MSKGRFKPCTYCGTTMSTHNLWTRPTRDHIQPLSRGGLNRASNRVWACYACNQSKADWLPVEWYWRLCEDGDPCRHHVGAFLKGWLPAAEAATLTAHKPLSSKKWYIPAPYHGRLLNPVMERRA